MRKLNLFVIIKLLVLFLSSVATAGLNNSIYTYYIFDGNLNDIYVDSPNGTSGGTDTSF